MFLVSSTSPKCTAGGSNALFFLSAVTHSRGNTISVGVKKKIKKTLLIIYKI